jgi:hypothetical protein
MSLDNNRLNQRIAAIAAARPLTVPTPKRHEEIRREQRKAVYRFGHLQLSDRSVLNCIVKDVSRNGARITLEGAISLPEMVILKIDLTGERRRARVAWQRDREAGLAFALEHSPVSLKRSTLR